MIAHVVLFTPRASLSTLERQSFLAALENACLAIAEIRRVRIGRRRHLGHAYDTAGPAQFEFAAVLEFDSSKDLQAYLEHPAHRELGRWFHHGAEVALAHDFEMVDAPDLRALVLDELKGPATGATEGI